MTERFNTLDIDCNFFNGIGRDDPRIDNNPAKGCWSGMYGHLDMIQTFYNDDSIDYGVFCEDDIQIHKDFKTIIPDVINDFKTLGLDVLLLGYLITFKIEHWFTGFNLKENVSKNELTAKNYKYHNYPNDIWGAQMYMLSKDSAKNILNKYRDETGYADKSFNNPEMTPFSADFTITKDGNRALIYPPLAIEDGKSSFEHYGHLGQYNFHKQSHDAHYDPLYFI
jgi:GR25 family glycosyltransferase involved in LPS biosynthesis